MKYRIKKKNVLILIGIITAIFALNFTFTYAKYVANNTWNYYLQSKNFYFSSDSLDQTGIKNVNTTWDGEKVIFNAKNFTSLDQITDYDITYKATCKVLSGDKTDCLMNGTNTNTFTGTLSSNQSCTNTKDSKDVSKYNKSKCEMEGYTWNKIEATRDLYFELKDDIKESLVEVTLEATAPYKKTLKGTFLLHKGKASNEEIIKTYKSYTNHDILSLNNLYKTNKCTKISFDSSKIRLDTTSINAINYTEDSNGYVNSITLLLEKNKNTDITFYKTSFDEIYDESNFTLEESTNCQ